MNSLNARESTLQRKGIKAKRANTNVTNAAKIDTRLSPGHSQLHTTKQILQQRIILLKYRAVSNGSKLLK